MSYMDYFLNDLDESMTRDEAMTSSLNDAYASDYDISYDEFTFDEV